VDCRAMGRAGRGAGAAWIRAVRDVERRVRRGR